MASVAELSRSLESARSRIKNAKAETETMVRRTVSMGAGLGTGVLLGLLDAKYGKTSPTGTKKARVPGTEIDADAALAMMAGTLGVSGLAGDASEAMVSVGVAAGACATRDWAYETTLKK